MPRPLRVSLLPQLVEPAELADACVVVFDVLRATTVVATALANGVKEIAPCLEIDEALALHSQLAGADVVLGGERGGLPIEGFNFGNSPREYSREAVSGKTLVFTTTNGTRALLHARQARRIYCGALVNAGAVVERIADEPSIHLLCAGTNGKISREDVLGAGWFVTQLLHRADDWELDDQAMLAFGTVKSLSTVNRRLAPGQPEDSIPVAIELSQGGRNLRRLGLSRDVFDAGRLDELDVVGEYFVAENRIRKV